MEINSLHERPDLENKEKLKKRFLQFDMLMNELRKREVPDQLIQFINMEIQSINEIKDSDGALKRQLRKSQIQILKKIEKELNLVVKNHFRNRWLGIGMALGIAIGSALGTGTGNQGLIGLGLPLGMAMGLSYGTNLDKKAKIEGKQLDLELP